VTARLSIVVPTLGRPTLPRTLASIAQQLGPEDEVIVVADAAGDVDGAVRALVVLQGARWRFERSSRSAPGLGNAQRMRGIELARGTHLLFMDDDDVYAAGALESMRDAACDRPVIFRMDATSVGLGVLWADPELRYANVGTPMFVVPNEPGRLGEWRPQTTYWGEGADFTFIVGCCVRMGEPVWREEIVAVIRPAASVTPSAPARSRREPPPGSPASAP
jgi:glycosyltransferase involved in cell wall biosynthesis